MSGEQASAELEAWWRSARRWWAGQNSIPRRRFLVIATAALMLIALFSPSDGFTWILLVVVYALAIVWVRHFRQLQGRQGLGPVGWSILVAGGVSLLLVGATVAIQAFTQAFTGGYGGSIGDTGTDQLTSGLTLIAIPFTLVANLIPIALIALLIWFFVRRKRGSAARKAQAAPSKANTTTLATAPTLLPPEVIPEAQYLLGVLEDPSQVGRLFYNAGLCTKLGKIKSPISSRSTTKYSMFDLASDAMRARNAFAARRPTKGRLVIATGDDQDIYQVPTFLGSQYSRAGVRAWFDILPGRTLSAYEKTAATLATELGLPLGIAIRQSPEDARNRRIEFHFKLTNPLLQVADYDWDAPIDYNHIPWAVDENAEVVNLGLYESNFIMGGIPGGGKSGGLTCYMTGLARLPNVAIVGLDPKRVEQGMWADRFTTISKDLDEIDTILEQLCEEMDRRYEELDRARVKKVPFDWFPRMPLIVAIADEMAEILAMGLTKEEADADTRRAKNIQRLVQKGRAAGIVFVGATQKPSSVTIPTSIRDLIAQKAAYATTTREMTETILGSGMASNGGLSHELSADERGVCYVISSSGRWPVKVRTYWVPDEEVEGIAKRFAHNRVELPWLDPRRGLDGSSTSGAGANGKPSTPDSDEDLLYDPHNDEDFSS